MPTITARPTICNRLYKLVRFIERHGGARGALSQCIAKLTHRTHVQLKPPGMSIDSDFKERFGNDPPADLRIQSSNVHSSLPYQPTREHIFRKAMQHVAIRHSDYAFVDIGAGKGLALLMAAEYPFKRVIGVEFSETLTLIARENVRTYRHERKCHDIQCICADGTEFTLPPEPIVLYFSIHFKAE